MSEQLTTVLGAWLNEKGQTFHRKSVVSHVLKPWATRAAPVSLDEAKTALGEIVARAERHRVLLQGVLGSKDALEEMLHETMCHDEKQPGSLRQFPTYVEHVVRAIENLTQLLVAAEEVREALEKHAS